MSYDEAKEYRLRAEEAEAEVARLRVALDAVARDRDNQIAALGHMRDAAGIALEWYDDGALSTEVNIAAYRRLRDMVKRGRR